VIFVGSGAGVVMAQKYYRAWATVGSNRSWLVTLIPAKEEVDAS